jgi:hypothetical protein
VSRTWHNGRQHRIRRKAGNVCRAAFEAPVTCRTGKRCYETESLAEAMLKLIQSERAYAPKVERRAYRCRICGQWHLTSQQHDVKRRAR